jgi:hypothetical protein
VKNFILVAALVALTTAGAGQTRAGYGDNNGYNAKPHPYHARKAPAKKAYGTKAPARKAYAARPVGKSYTPAKPYAPAARPTYKAAAKVYAPAKPAPAPYYKSHGVRFEGGYYYAGRKHGHWSETKYSSTYGTTVYHDPGLKVWYRWDDACQRYYPVDYKG